MEETFVTGRAVKGLGGRFEILGDDGGTYVCRAKGALKRDGGKLQIGDRVRLRIGDTATDDVVVDAILPRKNSLIRPPISNVDCIWLVIAAKDPDFAPDTADKMLAIAEHNGIAPAVIVTKCDLDGKAAEEIAKIYEKAGYPVFPVSSQTGEGIENVKKHIHSALQGGRIGAFAGASGVGKSTLIGLLFPTLERETGDVSQKTGRGRHTTRSVELLSLPDTDGFLADTPGFSLLDFERFDFFPLEELPASFPEIAAHLGHCRYVDCTHVKESAEDCSVRRALAEGKIAGSRHESYASLREVLLKKENTYK